jgi:hypothetical protein
MVVYDAMGQVTHEVTTVYELVGSGQSVAASKSAPMQPSEESVPGPESETPSKTEEKEVAGDPKL